MAKSLSLHPAICLALFEETRNDLDPDCNLSDVKDAIRIKKTTLSKNDINNILIKHGLNSSKNLVETRLNAQKIAKNIPSHFDDINVFPDHYFDTNTLKL